SQFLLFGWIGTGGQWPVGPGAAGRDGGLGTLRRLGGLGGPGALGDRSTGVGDPSGGPGRCRRGVIAVRLRGGLSGMLARGRWGLLGSRYRRMRHGEVQMAGEGTAGAFLVELQVPNDRLSVGGTVCGLLLSRLAFGGDSVLARTVGAGALRARVLVREA